jgi:hypothetical protein
MSIARKKPKCLLPADRVVVKPLREILATLDSAGTLERLPFMAEMVKFCGAGFRVYRRIERTCEEARGYMGRIQNVVFLDDLRCDGSEHGGCQKGCRIFWKEDWLTRPDGAGVPAGARLRKDEIKARLPSQLPDGLFICQSTELVNASSPLSNFDPMIMVRDIRSKTYTIPKLIGVLAHAYRLRLRHILTGRSFRFLQGRQTKTPAESLDLQPGEWVKVKTQDEIKDSLDKKGMNRGLGFTVDMIPDCGKSFRILRRLEKMIDESTRELIELKDTVLLEDSVCRGCYILKGGCPRENFNFWREIWLRREERDVLSWNTRKGGPDRRT